MTPLSHIWARRRRWAVGLALGATMLPAAPPPSTGVTPLIEAFRAAIAEAEQIPDPFGSGLDVLAGARPVLRAAAPGAIAARPPNGNDCRPLTFPV